MGKNKDFSWGVQAKGLPQSLQSRIIEKNKSKIEVVSQPSPVSGLMRAMIGCR
jgi:hypothetical protein